MAELSTGIGRFFMRFSLCLGFKKPPELPPHALTRSPAVTDFKKYQLTNKKIKKDYTHKGTIDRDMVGENQVHEKNPDKE